MPTSDDLDAAIIAEHARGSGRNQIARETGASRRRVSAVVAAAGLTFPGARRTATATAARGADSHERRAAVVARVLDAADKVLDDLDRLAAPRDVLAAERRARAVAAVAQSVGAVSRARPLGVADDALGDVQAVFAGFLTSAREAAAEPYPNPLDDIAETHERNE